MGRAGGVQWGLAGKLGETEMADLNVSLLERCRALLASGEPPPPHTLRAVAELLGSSGAAPQNSAGRLIGGSVDGASLPAHGAPGTSLQLGAQPDPRMERILQRHAARDDQLPVDIRAQKVRQFQALLEGEGGKYVHADYKPDGGTQIGNYVSTTPSMYAKWDSPSMFKESSTILGRGAPPIKKSVSSNRAFRVA